MRSDNDDHRVRTRRSITPWLTGLLALTLAGVAAVPGAIDAAEPPLRATVRVVTIDGADTTAPDELDRVRVVQHGAEDAANVLVLVPGTSAGATYFSPVALDIVEALPEWQVWAVDRRENLLEDHSMHELLVAGEAATQEAFDYYIGWPGDDSITEHLEPQGGNTSDGESVGFAREWGMAVAVDDLRAVIGEAASLGGDVVLGGHSLGGSVTIAYATWDFDGLAGADDLAGIALIDGGGGASATPMEPAEAELRLVELEQGSPFNDVVGVGLPWASGVFNMLGSTGALLRPDEASVSWQSPLVPENLKAPVLPTNEAQYGYALDTKTSPDGLELVEMHIGRLADDGEPRTWVDDGLVPVERAARMFSGVFTGNEPGPDAQLVGAEDELGAIDGTAWYHPRRLSLDSAAVNGGIANPAQDLLGVRAVHGRDLDLPIYALETRFGAGRVLAGAQLLAEQSGIPDEELTLVDRSDSITHTDPMGIHTAENPLVATLVPFLEGIG
jgi:pimeloyl-ACP methyl ester carboxylesterase